MSDTIIHSATLISGGERATNAWVRFSGGQVAERGIGRTWQEHISAGADRASVEIIDASGALLVPGFIDLHLHGGGGASIEDGTAAISGALDTHLAHGTTRAVCSLVSAPIDSMVEHAQTLHKAKTTDPRILGCHFEGPFLAESHKGAHDPRMLHAPTEDEIDALLELGDAQPRIVTLAPELQGSMVAIERLTDAGIVTAVGHTATTYDGAKAAFAHGASLLTHTFNGMSGMHHREPGPVGAALDSSHVVLELIADGVHVHQSMMRMLHALAGDRVAAITDAMAAAGASDGSYVLGGLEVEVRGGVARLPGGGSIAGSTLTLNHALKRLVSECDWQLEQAVNALTQVPARVMGLNERHGALEPGMVADAVLLDESFEVRQVWIDGVRRIS